jgi:hypothetical protein
VSDQCDARSAPGLIIVKTLSAHATGHTGSLPISIAPSPATSFRYILILLTLSHQLLAAAAATFDAPIVPADPAAAGHELVTRLLALRPAESVTNEAVLRIRANKTNEFEVPLRIEVCVGETNWATIYRTLPGTNSMATFTLTVRRQASGTNVYELRRDVGDSAESKQVAEVDAMTPFAGSDFWLGDLGMVFLHWPTQRLLKKEICRGQSCDKLESVAPQGWTNGYVRVVSWFDIDTGGPVLVEAYDAKGKMMKEFKPNDFTKVNGQWQVEELEMNNLRTGSRSFLHFKLEGK